MDMSSNKVDYEKKLKTAEKEMVEDGKKLVEVMKKFVLWLDKKNLEENVL